MSVAHNTAAASTWGNTSVNINCSGTYRYLVAFAVSDTAYATGCTHNGTSMDIIASLNVNGWYIRAFGLQNPATGSLSLAATGWSSHANRCVMGVAVNSTTADIVVLDYGTGNSSGSGSVNTTISGTSTSNRVAACAAATDGYFNGDGYTTHITGASGNTTRSDGSDYSAGCGSIAGTTTSTTVTGSNGSASPLMALLAVALSDSGGGGPTTKTASDTASLATSETPLISGTATAADTGSLAISESASASILTAVPASDTGSLAISESASVIATETKAASDTGSLSISESASVTTFDASASANQIPFHDVESWVGGGTYSFECGGASNRMLVVTVLADNLTAPTVTYNGVSVPLISTQAATSGEGAIFLYRLANPASGVNDLVVSTCQAITALAYSNVGSVQSISGTDLIGTAGTKTLSGISSGVGERLVSIISMETSSPLAVSLTATPPLKRRSYVYPTGLYSTFAVAGKTATASSEEVEWTAGSGGTMGRLSAFSMVPASTVSLPNGEVSIEFIGADADSIFVQFAYSGSDSVNFEYRLNGGSWTSVGNPSPREFSISSGITADTDYTIDFRAYTSDGPNDYVTDTVHSEAAGLSSPDYVDSNHGYSYGPQDGGTPTTVTFSLTTEGPDACVVVAMASSPLAGAGALSVTFNGTTVPQHSSIVLAGNAYRLFVLTDAPIGTYNVVATDANEYAENVQAAAVSYKNIDSVRTASTTNTNSTLTGISSGDGERLVSAIMAAGGTVSGSTDLTVRRNRTDSGYILAIGDRLATGTSMTATWTNSGSSSRGVFGVSLVPTAGTSGGDPPEGDVDFDAAVGYNSIALRDPSYDGADSGTLGHRLQHQYKVNGGAWSSVQNATAPYLIGGSFSPEDVITVRMRAANNYGAGDWSSEKSFRIHYSWHRTGVKKYSPSAFVGHAAAMYDVTATEVFDGPLTTGGTDRMVFTAYDVSYGRPNTNPVGVTAHDVEYDGSPSTRFLRMVSAGGSNDRREGTGGCEAHYQTGVPSGQHTLSITWADPQMDHTPAITAAAFHNVLQSDPIASWKGRLYPANPSHPEWGNATDYALDNIGATQLGLANVPASMDELVLAFAGFYASTTGSLPYLGVPEMEGEAYQNSAWGGDALAPPSLYIHKPVDDNIVRFCGASEGINSASRLAMANSTFANYPLHDQVWTEVTSEGFASLFGVAIRPSPNMIYSLTVPTAAPGGITWACSSHVNHGRVLVAITATGDAEPTSAQIRDYVDGTSTTTAYSGTFLGAHEYDISSAGTIGSTVAGHAVGTYRMTVAYESWQWNLGTQISTTFDVVAFTVNASDGLALSLSDATSGLRSTSALADSWVIGFSDSLTLKAIFGASDTGALSISDALTLLAIRAQADTASLSIAEAALPLRFSALADAWAISLSDAVTGVMAAQVVGDTGAIDSSEAASYLVPSTTSDDIGLDAADAITGQSVSILTTDSVGLLVSGEVPINSVSLVLADTGALTIAEAYLLLGRTSLADALSLPATSESAAITTAGTGDIIKSISDALSLPAVSAETPTFGGYPPQTITVRIWDPDTQTWGDPFQAIVGGGIQGDTIGFIVGDSLALAISESISGSATTAAADTAALAITETRTVNAVVHPADTLALAMSDLAAIGFSQESRTAVDGIVLGLTESAPSVFGSIYLTDIGVVGAIDQIRLPVAVTLSRSDTLALTMAEAVSGTGTLGQIVAADPNLALAISEAAQAAPFTLLLGYILADVAVGPTVGAEYQVLPTVNVEAQINA